MRSDNINNTEVVDDQDEYESLEPTLTKKKAVGIIILIALILIVSMLLYWWQNQLITFGWENKISFAYKENGFSGNALSGDYYETYEVTNVSNKTLHSVYAVIEVKDVGGKSFRYKDYVTFTLRPKEVIEYKFFSSVETSREASERNINLILPETDIVGFCFE